MQNLPHGLVQTDRLAYQALSHEGSENYETLYMSGKAVEKKENFPRGISADDFNVFATMIYAYADHSAVFRATRKLGKSIRHIDAGTGPNLYTCIASLPYVDEFIAVDLSPANIERLHAIVSKKTHIPAHWHAWLEIAALLYDIGSVKALVALDAARPDLYDQLRQWPNLSARQKAITRKAVYKQVRIQAPSRNPYAQIDIHRDLVKNLHPHKGDILDDVEPLSHLIGTADIYTGVFFAESVDDKLEVVAHAVANGIQFAKENALVISSHISKTTGYAGFFTKEELQSTPGKQLVELPGTAKLFETIAEQVVVLTNTYRQLWENLEEGSEQRKMVRPGSVYGSAVILCGKANHRNPDGSNKYENGPELLRAIKDLVRTVTVTLVSVMHCAASEVQEVAEELTNAHTVTGNTRISASINPPIEL